MDAVSGWDVALVVLGCYVAVTSLVRLMRRRRDERLVQYRQQLRRERLRQRQSAELADPPADPPRRTAA